MKPDLSQWLSEVTTDTDSFYEAVPDESFVNDEKPFRQHVYDKDDVAWEGFYVYPWRVRNQWYTACVLDGEVFSHRYRSEAIHQVQTHILRHDRPPMKRYIMPDECPY